MATVLSPSDQVRSSIWTADSEQASVNVLHWRVQSVGGSPATDADLAIALDTIIAPVIKPVIANTATYRGVEVQILFPTLQLAVSATGFTGVGTAGANALPRQTAALTQWRTTLAGRHGRGRSYWPFPASALNQLDGVMTPAGLALYQALHLAILNFGVFTVGGRTATVALTVYNRVTHVGTVVSAATTLSKWGTQKRRGSFGRPNLSPI